MSPNLPTAQADYDRAETAHYHAVCALIRAERAECTTTQELEQATIRLQNAKDAR